MIFFITFVYNIEEQKMIKLLWQSDWFYKKETVLLLEGRKLPKEAIFDVIYHEDIDEYWKECKRKYFKRMR